MLSRPLPDCEAQGAGDANGQVSELVPKHTANFSASYSRNLNAEMDWFVKSFLNYESKKYVTIKLNKHHINMSCNVNYTNIANLSEVCNIY